MSINFYAMAKAKSQQTTMKREKFRKQDKTNPCSISNCRYPGIKTVQISEKENRRLCAKHWSEWTKGTVKPPKNPNFVRASQI